MISSTRRTHEVILFFFGDPQRHKEALQREQPMNRLPEFSSWPLLKQWQQRDLHAAGTTSVSERTAGLKARLGGADRVVPSICPYCAVGCGQLVYVKDERIINIEGDPDSPISGGCLCPKGAATFQLVTGSGREKQVLYRKPHGTEWIPIPLSEAMEMVAQRVKQARDEHWENTTADGDVVNRTLSMAHLGGATLDNEENYLLKKLYSSLGVIQVENQARI